MASLAKTSGHLPSLPRLLSLDKTRNTFEEQILQAATIAGIAEELLVQEKLGNNKAQVQGHKSQSRQEWVLKWLLEKLKARNETGSQARSLPLSWRLLRTLVESLPVSVAARQLSANGILDSLEKTLEENLATFKHSVVESGGQNTASAKPSRKRKRQDDVSKQSGGVAATENGGEVLFGAIDRALETIHHQITIHTGTVDVAAREHMKSTLRTATDQAARLLNLWTSHIVQILQKSRELVITQQPTSVILAIWEWRLPDPSDESGGSIDAFTSICLSSITKLVGVLLGKKVPGDDLLLRSARKLLTDHLLAPAHRLYVASESSRKKTPFDSDKLVKYLTPLQSDVETLNDTLCQHGAIPADSIMAIFPFVLEQTIITSRSNRLVVNNSTNSWLEIVFFALAEVAGVPLKDGSKIGKIHSRGVQALQGMLDVVSDRKAILHSSTFEAILSLYSGLRGDAASSNATSATISWPLVAGVMNLDGDIFIPSRRKTQNANESDLNFGRILVRRLTELDFSSSETSSVQEQQFVTEKVLVPLMQTYVKARDLKGFMTVWFDALAKNWTSIHHGGSASLSVWASNTLRRSVWANLETSLTTAQIVQLVNEHLVYFGRLRESLEVVPEKDNDVEAHAVAAAFILDVLLGGIIREENVQQLQAALIVLNVSLSGLLLSSNGKLEHSSGFWHLLSRVDDLLSQSQEFAAKQQRRQQMLNSKLLAVADVEKNLARHAAVSFLFTFSTACIDDPALAAQASVIVRKVANDVCQKCQGLNGDKKSLSRLHVLEPTLRELGVNLVRSAQTLRVIPSEDRKILFRSFLTCLCRGELGDSKQGDAWGDLTAALADAVVDEASYEIRGKCRDFVEEVKSALLENLDSADTTQTIERILLRLPPQAIQRNDREAVLDLLVKSQRFTATEALLHLGLLARLLSTSCLTASICSTPKILISFCTALQQAAGFERQHHQIQGATFGVAKLAYRQVLEDSQTERKQKFIEECSKALLKEAKAIKKAAESTKGTKTNLQVVLICAWLEQMEKADQANANIQKITKALQPLENDLLKTGFPPIHRLVRHTLREETPPILKTDDPVMALIHDYAGIMIHALSGSDPVDFREFMNDLDDRLQKCDRNTRVRHFIAQCDMRFKTQKRDLKPFLLDSLEPVVDDAELVLEISDQLPRRFCPQLKQASSYEDFIMLINCTYTIISKKPWMTTQYGIEFTLETLATIVSPRASLASGSPKIIYDRVCETTKAIVSLHRRNLNGRMHLLVPLLQGLLSCLFVPHPHSPASADRSPPWLKSGHPSAGIHEDSATCLARVLTTLCSPTVSSVTGHKRPRVELVDETKKARQYAAQYVPYVIMHFCQLQLNAYLKPEVRKVLMPGIWAMLELLDEDLKKVLNESLGRDERALWHSLYGEWRRSGRA